jgi:site-specific DNA-methyltransferase (adenine-specific)
LIIFIGGLNKLKIMKITEKITITNEDCMDLLRRTPDKFYQLAIIDPPYGIGADVVQNELGGKKGFTKGAGTYKKYHSTNWDNKVPNKEYFDELFRVSKNQIIWGGNYFFDVDLSGIVIWNKLGSGTFKDGELAKTSINTFKIFSMSRADAYINNGDEKIHPTQKPKELYKWLLDKYAKQGDKILDTHLGSGSIAIACHDYGFELTACELDVDYYNKAVERIKNHISQIKLEL